MALTDTVRFVITLEKAELAKLARLALQAHTSIAEQVRQAVYRLPERTKKSRGHDDSYPPLPYALPDPPPPPEPPALGKVAGPPPPQAKTEESSLTSMAHERTLDYSEGQ